MPDDVAAKAKRLLFVLGLPFGVACTPEAGVEPVPGPERIDDPQAFVEDPGYRRAVLESDLTVASNGYAERRLAAYGIPGLAWEILPLWDPPSRSLRASDVAGLVSGEALEVGDLPWTTLAPTALPSSEDEWLALGEQVFFEYPLRVQDSYLTLAGLDGGLEEVGFLVEDEEWVGLRVLEGPDGAPTLGPTCAQCHGGRDGGGRVGGVRANRQMDVGRSRLLTLGAAAGGALPPELESTAEDELSALGPGRMDVLSDGVFNPYAVPDLGGLIDMPFLHHNANWHHRGTATLAVRCDTLFITSGGEDYRPPLALSWALAAWLRSLPAPQPSDGPSAEAEAGALVFEDLGCPSCHPAPLYTAAHAVELDAVGTDPSAGESEVRWSGNYRIPSLRGVGGAGPYLHHGAVATLDALFDPTREEPGHSFGQEAEASERAALVAFLRSL